MDKSYLNLGILFAGMGLVFGTILIVREISRTAKKPENCTSVTIMQVGGCNSDGVCGVLFLDGNGLVKGTAHFPVAGQTICREDLFN